MGNQTWYTATVWDYSGKHDAFNINYDATLHDQFLPLIKKLADIAGYGYTISTFPPRYKLGEIIEDTLDRS